MSEPETCHKCELRIAIHQIGNRSLCGKCYDDEVVVTRELIYDGEQDVIAQEEDD